MQSRNNDPQYRALTPKQIISWVKDDRQIIRLRSDRDVILGGYMAAAVPMLVDWPASDPHGDPA